MRIPSEFRVSARTMSTVCVDRDGRVDSIKLLSPLHPRYAASIIDAFRLAEYTPFIINGRPVAFCSPVLVNFELGGG